MCDTYLLLLDKEECLKGEVVIFLITTPWPPPPQRGGDCAMMRI